jgi:hypothetical protein
MGKGSHRSAKALEGYFQIRKLETFIKVTRWLLKQAQIHSFS